MRIPLLLLTCAIIFAQTPPKKWTDPDTHHRIVRLTDEPGSASLYFNQNGYTPDGKKLVYTTPNGISTFDLANPRREASRRRTRAHHRSRPQDPKRFLHQGTRRFRQPISIPCATREIANSPQRGSVVTVNADETLLAGTYTEAQGPTGNAYASPVRQRSPNSPIPWTSRPTKDK